MKTLYFYGLPCELVAIIFSYQTPIYPDVLIKTERFFTKNTPDNPDLLLYEIQIMNAAKHDNVLKIHRKLPFYRHEQQL